MPHLTLTQRLLLFWFAATTAVLVVAGATYSTLRHQSLAEEGRRQLVQALQRLDTEMLHRSEELNGIADTLAATSRLQASLRLFHGYFAAAAGSPDIFDAPAEQLGTMLGESGRTTGLDWIIVSGDHGPVAGYAAGRMLYWSQRSTGPQLLASSSSDTPFVPVPEQPLLSRPGAISDSVQLAACRTAPGLAMVREQAVLAADGTRIGTLSVGNCLDQQLVDRIAAEAGLPFAIDGGPLLQSSAMKAAGRLPEESQPMALADPLDWLPAPRLGTVDDTTYVVAEKALAEGGVARFIFTRDPGTADGTTATLVGAGLAALAAVSLLVMVVGLVFLRRQVTEPLDQLMGAVDSARAGQFQPLADDLPHNELGSLARLLNETMAQLLRQQTHLHTLVDTIPDLIWLKDGNGVYLACNPSFERFFGVSEKEIVGKTDYDFVAAELADAFRQRDQAAMAAGRPTSNEEWLTFASDGYRGLFSTTKTPMTLPDGTLIGILGIAHDITALRNAMDEIAGNRDQLEIKVRQRSAQLA